MIIEIYFIEICYFKRIGKKIQDTVKDDFFSTKQISRKYNRAVSGWKRLCVLAVLLCVCGAAWGQTYYAYKWTGKLETNSITGDLASGAKLERYVDSGAHDDVFYAANGSTDPASWTEKTLADFLSDAVINGIILLPGETPAEIGNFTIPKNVELAVFIGKTINVVGNLIIEGKGKVNTHGAFNFKEGSSITVTSQGEFVASNPINFEVNVDVFVEENAIFPNDSQLSGTPPSVKRDIPTVYYWVGGNSDDDTALEWNNAANWSKTNNGAGGAGIPGTNHKAVLRNDTQNVSHKFIFTDNANVRIIDAFRPAQSGLSNDYQNTYIFRGNVTLKGDLITASPPGGLTEYSNLIIHSGVHIVLEGADNEIKSITTHGSASDASTSLTIKGKNKSDTISIAASTNFIIDEHGELNVKTSITSANPITNKGTIIGGVSTISAPYITGTGDISVTSGTITLSSTSTASTIKNLTIGTGGTFSAQKDVTISENLTNSGAIALTSGDLTVNGNLTNTNANANAILVSGNLSVGGTTETASPIVTTGNQTYSGNFTLTGTGDKTLQVGGTTLSFGGTFTGNNGNVTIVASDSNERTVTFDGNVIGVGNLTSNYITNVNGTVTTTGDQTYNGKVTLAGVSTFNAANSKFSGSIDVTSSKHNLTITGNTEIAGDNTFGVLEIKNGNSTFTGANEFGTLDIDNSDDSIVTSPTTAAFATDKLQKIGTCSFKGSSSNSLTLKSTGTGNWKVCFGTKPTDSNFTNVIVEQSSSVKEDGTANELNLVPSLAAVYENFPSSNSGWFKYVDYYWVGTNSSDWNTKSNWQIKDVSGNFLSFDGISSIGVPPKIDTDVIITIKDGTSSTGTPWILKFPSEIKSKSITVNFGTTVDFNGQAVTASDATVGITNNGKIQLQGAETIAAGTKTQSDGSTIEYYGVCSSRPWGEDYSNLIFASGASGTISGKLSVSGTTKVDIGAGKSLALESAENNFSDAVTITSGGASLNGSFQKAVNIASADDVTLSGAFKDVVNISSTGNDVALSGSFDKAVELNSKVNNLSLNMNSDVSLKTATAAGVNSKLTVSLISPSTGLTFTDAGDMTSVAELLFIGAGEQKFANVATIYPKITVDKNNSDGNALAVVNALNATNLAITKNHTTTFGKSSAIGTLAVTDSNTITFSEGTTIATLDVIKNNTLTFGADTIITTLTDAAGAGDITFNGGTNKITNISVTGELLTTGTVTFGGIAGTSTTTVTGGFKHTAENCKTVINGTLNVGGDTELGETKIGGVINAADSSGVKRKLEFGDAEIIADSNITSADIIFGSLVLSADATINCDNATFNSSVKSDDSSHHSLSVNPSGTGIVLFAGNVGGGANEGKELSSINVNGATNISCSSISSMGTQNYAGSVTLLSDTSLSAKESDATISFNSTLDGEHNISVSANKINLVGMIGNETPLSSFTSTGDLTLSGGLVKTTGTQTYNGKVTVNTADITFTGSSASPSIILNGNVSSSVNVTFGTPVEIASDIIISTEEKNITFNSSVDGGHNLAIDSVVSFESAVGSVTPLASLELKKTSSINGGLVKTSGAQKYCGNVTSNFSLVLDGDVIICVADFNLATSNGDLIFEKTITAESQNVSLATGTGVISLKGDVSGVLNFDVDGEINIGVSDNAAVTVASANINFKKSVKEFYGTLVSGNVTFNADASINDGTITNSGILLTSPNTTISASNRFVQNGTGQTMIGGNFVTSNVVNRSGNEISFAQDVYLYGSPASPVIGGGDSNITIGGNFIIAYDSAVQIAFDSPIIAKNIVLYAGDLKVNKNLSSTEDIVLLGSNYADNDGEEDHGIDEFKYTKRRRKGYSYKGFDSETRDKFPNRNRLPESDSYKGTFTVAPGVSVKVGENFFANGISLTGVSDSENDIWYLDAKQNSDASVCFIEAYISLIKNSVVRCYKKGDGTLINPPLEDYQDDAEVLTNGAADDSCDDGGNKNNKNWDLRPFEILRAYTVSDNVVRVELSGELRNHYRELEDNVGYITFNNNGAEEGFSKVYKSYEIKDQYEKSGATIETENFADGEDISTFYYGADGKKVYYFYLQTSAEVGDKNSASRWNTDATGKNAGNEKSTDNHGKHQNAIPSIKFSRTLDGHAEAYSFNFTNKWGKILVNSGTPYEDTADCAAPVLTAVYSGQETHNPNVAEQHSYDAHNYLEFVFSEPVDFGAKDDSEIGWLPSYADDGVSPSVLENIKSAKNFGAIESSSSAISVSGLVKINSGSLATGTDGKADSTVHGFYRSSPHKLRLSIAGYTDGVVTDNYGNEYKKWIGYIDSATSPVNDSLIELQQNTLSFVNDLALGADGNPAPNSCKLRNYANYKNGEDLKLNYASSETYLPDSTSGLWDVVKPSFAVYRNVEKPWKKENLKEAEAIGSTIDGTSSLKRLEFHLFDNEPSYSDNDNYQWVTKQGWVKPFDTASNAAPELYEEYSYAADVFGGARPFAGNPDDESSSRTSGGIRYCSIADAYDSFRYMDMENGTGEPDLSFDSSLKAFAGASSPIFQPARNPSRNPTGSDSLYFGYNLSNTILSLRTHFSITYDSAKGYITDLAGNRLGNGGKIKIKTKDLTPPSFNMTIAPVGQNKIYIMFTKILSTNSVKLINENNNEVVKDALTDAYPNAFGLYELTDGNIPSESKSIKIDSSVPAKVLYQNDDYMGLELTLTRDVTFDDVQKLYLVAKPQAEKYKDPIIDISSTFTTFIQDKDENYITAYTAHALSDFAVGVINPLYAYNESIDDGSDKVQINLYGEGTNAVHDWDAEQQNFGTLVSSDEIHIISSVKISSSENETFKEGDFKARIYLDNNPPPESVSDEYNKTANPLESWRIWLPPVTGFDMFTPLAKVSNGNFDVAVDGVSGGDYDFDFVIPREKVSEWASGDQVSFLFSLHDSNNNPLTVVHTPVYDYSENVYSLSDKFPLFALRLKNHGDLTSLDLWSFKLKSQVLQRGGVTILNNVINASKSEKTVVRVDNPSGGKVDVIVMTLDGNVIEYLNRGNLDAGTHYFTWDGHNRNKKPVARGMYFVRVIGNGFDETRKVMVVK